MSIREAFLADILAEPADDGVRLIFADWLTDNGQPERGEFIRVQCELAMVRGEGTGRRCAHYVPLRFKQDCTSCQSLCDRERKLLAFVPSLPFWAVLHWLDQHGPPPGGREGATAIWRRGFVAEIHCLLADWYNPDPERANGPRVVAAHPVAMVRATDRVPRHILSRERTGRPSWYWLRTTTHLAGIPEEMLLRMEGEERTSDGVADYLFYWSEADALAALSAALLAWAREQADALGLWPLAKEVSRG